MPSPLTGKIKTQKESTSTYLALGDSYTIGESLPASERYPEQAVSLLNNAGFRFLQPEIVATTGWTTADLQKAINNYHFKKSNYDIVSLLIGVNNQYRGRSPAEYQEEFTQLIQKSIALTRNRPSHVIVLSIPDYSVTPFAKGSNVRLVASGIDSFNVINKQIAESYRVAYIDITGESRKAATDSTLISTDHLHYSGKEYAIWAAMLAEQIKHIYK
ncbi:MAG TPA: SGNH/GDSL hydrolase family protein [Puia sp.]|nr:SGNH/GDSL hydrolase family protein [Puia sp.]